MVGCWMPFDPSFFLGFASRQEDLSPNFFFGLELAEQVG